MRIALAQLNTIVGDLEGNVARILDAQQTAQQQQAGLLVTPELALTGYPPKDLLFKSHFVSDQLKALDDVIRRSSIPILVGYVESAPDGRLHNSAALIEGNKLTYNYRKWLLPTYDVFDELRYFSPGTKLEVIEFGGVKTGITICEDLWDDDYDIKVARELSSLGAELVVNLSSSPFHIGKHQRRQELLSRQCTAGGIDIAYCNRVGAQDDLVFDGNSMVVNREGKLVALGAAFAEDILYYDTAASETGDVEYGLVEESELFQALCLGLRDYLAKSGFNRVVLGLSGGIDSALAACIAAGAIGAENVTALGMSTQYTSQASEDDARELAANLGIEFHLLRIDESIDVAARRYKETFGTYRHPVTLENLQARERGKILMEYSNDTGAMVIATGNKTEYALGYSTLYGDMCGGLAVIGDLTKPMVYQLTRYFTTDVMPGAVPERILTRPPSAELREGQVDPFDYDRIGPLTEAIVEDHLGPDELMQAGYTEAEMEMVFRLIRTNEHKRIQAPPILRVTEKAFGPGRQMPIVNHYRW
jgi:NAD+ synthetase